MCIRDSNIASWNALKSVRADGMFLNPAQAAELLDIYHQGEFLKAQWDGLRPVSYTHLDVYKRQMLDSSHNRGVRHSIG